MTPTRRRAGHEARSSPRGSIWAAGGEDLRARLVARDERALAELIDVASPWLLGIAQGMLQDPVEAEEVVLEVMTIAWNRIELVGAEGSALMPWLLRVTRNRTIDRLRARRRRGSALAAASADPGIVRHVEDESRIDEAGAPGWHVHRSVHAALDSLPEDQRTAVRLAYFEGLTHSEIAERLAIPLGTVKTRLRLGFGRLRVSLAPIKDWVL
ncbi:MAG: sigma-70 family RNA polymerase sigma factor [Gemmatimonadales bacterium]|nr:sigma-70 family RNA polymerase sigma factor [Gemmatimonadales bacterium]